MASKIIVDQIEKTGGSLTALTLPTGNASASQYLQNDGAGALSWASASAGFSDVDTTTSTGSTTYTVPSDITKLLVIITGGGGGASGGSYSVGWGGMGGVGGTTVIARVTVVAADTITIAIGAGGGGGADSTDGTIGGDSTFTHASGTGSGSMSTITSPGGKPGRHTNDTVAPAAGTVGANNEGISILGGYGSIAGGNSSSGGSGASFWGGGGQGGQMASVQTATAGTAYGSGGGPGNGSNAGIVAGAAGADGVCFIMEFK